MTRHSFRQRATEMEDMDDFSLEGEELKATLHYLAFVNRFLGGHQIIIQSLHKTFLGLGWLSPKLPYRLLDIGCGGGDTLCQVAKWAKDQKLAIKIDGIDANASILDFAREKSEGFPEINYIEGDIFDKHFKWSSYQIVLCSLILHHFDDDQIVRLFKAMPKGTVIIINDLQRHILPYWLFKGFCWITNAPPMARKDGEISIRKGFSKRELEQLMARSNISQYNINWRWAFRYQLILVK